MLKKSVLFFKFFVNRKIISPLRSSKWKKKKEVFQHKGEKGLKFHLYTKEYIDRFIYIDGIYEKRFLKFIEKIQVKKHTMLDIGANIGNHSLYLSDLFRYIHSFEPNPTTIERLKKNIALNHCENITVHPVGLGSEDATLPFVENIDGNLGCSHFQEKESHDSIFLHVKNGDSYIKKFEIGNIDFIKIDVEGFELKVLKGLKQTIEIHRPIISFEFHAYLFEENYFEKIREELKNYVFVNLVFAQQNVSYLKEFLFHFRNIGMPDIEIIREIENKTYDNILALPSSDMLSRLLERN